jgi:drug/metabolite transporter (DMT)-like permease
MRWVFATAVGVCLLLPSVALAESNGLKLPTMVAGAAAAADWASTYHALSRYHLRESNPLLRPFDSTPGQMVTLGAVIDGAVFSAWNFTVGQKYPRVAAAGLWGMAAFRSYLVIHNVRNMRKAPMRPR